MSKTSSVEETTLLTAIKIFRQVPLFQNMSDEGIEFLARRAREKYAAAREIVSKEGDVGEDMFIIGLGEVEVTKALGHPDESVLAILHSGDFFGEMCLIESAERTASVRASDTSLLYALNAKDLESLFEHSPEQFGNLMLNMARDLCRRIKSMNEAFAPRKRPLPVAPPPPAQS